MSRPLLSHGIVQLEGLFVAGKSDIDALRELERELQHRQTSRANALLAKVRAAIPLALVGAASKDPSSPILSRVHEPQAGEARTHPRDVPESVSDASEAMSLFSKSTAVKRHEATPVVPPVRFPPPAFAVPLEEAYKLLKTTPATPWEAIEETRRTLIQQWHPSQLKAMSVEKRSDALEEAKRINAAYASLSFSRCERL
jgi:hypothetical protein